MYGKRTDRLELPKQLRIDPDMSRQIRESATLNRRSIQQQLLLYVELELKAEKGSSAPEKSQV
jgi:hypothetical protein